MNGDKVNFLSPFADFFLPPLFLAKFLGRRMSFDSLMGRNKTFNLPFVSEREGFPPIFSIFPFPIWLFRQYLNLKPNCDQYKASFRFFLTPVKTRFVLRLRFPNVFPVRSVSRSPPQTLGRLPKGPIDGNNESGLADGHIVSGVWQV